MIEYIKGTIDELLPTQTTLETAGVGYLLAISLNTYAALQGKSQAKLFVHEAVRQDDATLLYGFATRQERELFRLLISVSGVGGQTARMVISAFTPTELVNIIVGEDQHMLKAVKGIGPKAAQRIIVELKDKVAKWDATSEITRNETSATADKATVNEAVAALTMLGFPPAAAQKAVVGIVKGAPALPVETIIKEALKML